VPTDIPEDSWSRRMRVWRSWAAGLHPAGDRPVIIRNPRPATWAPSRSEGKWALIYATRGIDDCGSGCNGAGHNLPGESTIYAPSLIVVTGIFISHAPRGHLSARPVVWPGPIGESRGSRIGAPLPARKVRTPGNGRGKGLRVSLVRGVGDFTPRRRTRAGQRRAIAR
jgi:hypothetical protein